MRILLTGSTGQIGWELGHALRDIATVIAPGRSELDLADPDAIVRTVRASAPDIVINAGGYTAVDRAEREPQRAEQINAAAPGILSEQARQANAAIVHFSTDYVFDGRKPDAYQPDDAPSPVSVYGRTKLAGEQAVRAANDSALILRLSWVYSLRRRNFLLAMLDQAQQRNELSVVDDQVGCPTPARLVAAWTTQIVLHAIDSRTNAIDLGGRTGVFHLACAGQTSWCGFARRIIELAELPHDVQIRAITTADYPTAATRPSQSVLNCDRTAETFGLEFVDWDTALRDVMADFRRAAATAAAGSASR